VKGTFSFHPVKVEFFDETIQPLLAARKVNPEAFLVAALKLRGQAARTRRYQWAIEGALVSAEPPPIEPGAGIFKSFRAHLERMDHREDELTRDLKAVVEPDLHLHGRPFFITEASVARVAQLVEEFLGAHNDDAVDTLAIEQLVNLGPDLAKRLQPGDGLDLSPDLVYRGDLLSRLKDLYDVMNCARRGENWGRADAPRRPAREVLVSELPHRSLWLHSRAVPFWIARDVDGLETVCRSAGVAPPGFVVPPRRLFAEACEEFPELAAALHVEVRGPADVGAFVAPGDIPELLEFLSVHGARIIQIASRHGEGPACSMLLRKIRECAVYAERTGSGYLEASGIRPPEIEHEPEPDPSA
jgi:hypothetical protein